MMINEAGYLEFLKTEIEVPAGKYTRAHLLALATSQLDVPASDLVAVIPELKIAAPPEDIVAVSTDAPDSLPWRNENDDVVAGVVNGSVDDQQMLEALKDITWSETEAPRGKPGLRHVFEVLAWLAGDAKRIVDVHEALLGGEFRKKPKPAKDLKALAEAICHMPVWDSARWLFTVWVDVVSYSAFAAAWNDKNIEPLVTELWNFGLDMDGLRPESDALLRAHQHSFMPAIVEGTREDGAYRKTGSCASVMKALKIVCDTLPADKHAQMYTHIMKNYDADKVKAMAPLMKILNAKQQGEAGVLICGLLSSGDVPVAVLAMVFQGEWDRLYSSLRSCLDTVGPIPPWLKASVV